MQTILALLFSALASVSWAQEGKPFDHRIWCFDQRTVIEVLSRDYQETAIFHGDSNNIQYVLYASEKTKGWTLVGYQDGQGCIIAAGKKHTQIFGTAI